MLQLATNLAVVCRGVVKEFGDGTERVGAPRGVDLDVPFGEMSMLVGPSGCGKTTLLSVIAGILDATSGQVEVLGTDLARISNGQKVRFRGHNIGFVFQQYNLLPALTAAENVAVPLIIAGVSRRRAVPVAESVLERLGMADRMHALPSDLSGGQQQRVAIGRALVHEPALVVCDEPTAALDAENGHRIMELLQSVALQADRAVIVVTHDNRVFGFADRIAHMEDGHISEVQINSSRSAAPAAAVG